MGILFDSLVFWIYFFLCDVCIWMFKTRLKQQQTELVQACACETYHSNLQFTMIIVAALYRSVGVVKRERAKQSRFGRTLQRHCCTITVCFYVPLVFPRTQRRYEQRVEIKHKLWAYCWFERRILYWSEREQHTYQRQGGTEQRTLRLKDWLWFLLPAQER